MAEKVKVESLKGGNQWIRVNGPNLCPQYAERMKVNMTRINAPDFKVACEMAGIPDSKRQASKWNNRKGAAYNVANKIEMNGFVLPTV